MRLNMQKVEQIELVVYPWSMSATGKHSKDSGLTKIRQYAKGEIPVDEMVELLWKPGADIQISTVMELIKHGSPRQAAVLVKALVKAHPICETSLKEWYGNDVIDDFLIKSPERYPSTPEEYPLHVKVRYIQ